MRTDLADEATELGAVASAAIESAGGDRLAQMVEQDPALRDTALVGPLAELGVWDLDIRAGGLELEAAAAVCRSVGYWAAPVAVAERLARPRDLEADALAVVAGPRPAAAMQASSLRWVGVDLDGNRGTITARPPRAEVRESGFVVEVDVVPIDDSGSGDAGYGLVLPIWTLLGMLDRAMELAISYVQEREQFGRPLAAFQAVQFQLTEAEVERAGLQELAKYSLWSLASDRGDALVDALALRLAAIEAADRVFRICHQLHGAIGFCDETTISWLSRASQPLRRQPLPLSGTRFELTRRAGRAGLAGLF